MKKAFKNIRSQIFIILTLIFVLVLVGFYYAYYIPRQEADMLKSKFRTLERVETNINKNLDNYHHRIETFVDKYKSDRVKDSLNNPKKYNKTNSIKGNEKNQRIHMPVKKSIVGDELQIYIENAFSMNEDTLILNTI